MCKWCEDHGGDPEKSIRAQQALLDIWNHQYFDDHSEYEQGWMCGEPDKYFYRRRDPKWANERLGGLGRIEMAHKWICC